MKASSICSVLAMIGVLLTLPFYGNSHRKLSAAEPGEPAKARHAADQPSSMLYIRATDGPIADVVKKLEKAVAANKFGVLASYNLKKKMEAKGVAFGPNCYIVEICNPKRAKTVLEADMSIANALPCRIAIYEEDGKVKVSTMKPTAVLGLFGRPELKPVAQDVERAMIRMIDAACDDPQ